MTLWKKTEKSTVREGENGQSSKRGRCWLKTTIITMKADGFIWKFLLPSTFTRRLSLGPTEFHGENLQFEEGAVWWKCWQQLYLEQFLKIFYILESNQKSSQFSSSGATLTISYVRFLLLKHSNHSLKWKFIYVSKIFEKLDGEKGWKVNGHWNRTVEKMFK